MWSGVYWRVNNYYPTLIHSLKNVFNEHQPESIDNTAAIVSEIDLISAQFEAKTRRILSQKHWSVKLIPFMLFR